MSDAIREGVAHAIFAADGSDSDWRWEPGRWERASSDERGRYLRLADAALAYVEQLRHSASDQPRGSKRQKS